MKKTSLFILLILLTFSLSQSNFKIHFQSKQAYIGIREIDKIYDYISQKMNIPKNMKKKIQVDLDDLIFNEKNSGSANSYTSIPNKLREFKINSYRFEGEALKINEKYAIYLIYISDGIIEKPPKYERKCKSGFLGIGKNCKNVEFAQSFSENEMKEVNKEIRDKIIVNAFVDLPKEDYEQYKQILRFKFPQNKNLK